MAVFNEILSIGINFDAFKKGFAELESFYKQKIDELSKQGLTADKIFDTTSLGAVAKSVDVLAKQLTNLVETFQSQIGGALKSTAKALGIEEVEAQIAAIKDVINSIETAAAEEGKISSIKQVELDQSKEQLKTQEQYLALLKEEQELQTIISNKKLLEIDAQQKITDLTRADVERKATTDKTSSAVTRNLETETETAIKFQNENDKLVAKRIETEQKGLIAIGNAEKKAQEQRLQLIKDTNKKIEDALTRHAENQANRSDFSPAQLKAGAAALEDVKKTLSPIEQFSGAFSKNIFSSLGTVLKFRLAWVGFQIATEAALAPVNALVKTLETGIGFLAEMQDRAAQLREVLASNVIFSDDVAENFKKASIVSSALAPKIELAAAKLGVSSEVFERAFEKFGQNRGLEFVGGDTEKAVKSVQLLIAGIGSLGINLTNGRQVANDIQSFLNGTATPLNNILKASHLTLEEYEKILKVAKERGNLEEVLSQRLSQQLITLQQSNQRFTALKDTAEVYFKIISGAFSKGIFDNTILGLQVVNAELEKNLELLKTIFELLGKLASGTVFGTALGRPEQGIADVITAFIDKKREELFGTEKLSPDELKPKGFVTGTTPEEAKQKFAELQAQFRTVVDDIKAKGQEARQAINTDFDLGRLTSAQKTAEIVDSFKKQNDAIQKEILNFRTAFNEELNKGFNRPEQVRINEQLTQDSIKAEKERDIGVLTARSQFNKEINALERERLQNELKIIKENQQTEEAIFEAQAKTRLLQESDIAQQRLESQQAATVAETIALQKVFSKGLFPPQERQKIVNQFLELQNQFETITKIGQEQITEAANKGDLDRFDFHANIRRKELDFESQLNQLELSRNQILESTLLQREIDRSEKEKALALARVNLEEQQAERAGGANQEEFAKKRLAIEQNFTQDFILLSQKRIEAIKNETRFRAQVEVEIVQSIIDVIKSEIEVQQLHNTTIQERLNNTLKLEQANLALLDSEVKLEEITLARLRADNADKDIIAAQEARVRSLVAARATQIGITQDAQTKATPSITRNIVQGLFGNDTSGKPFESFGSVLKALAAGGKDAANAFSNLKEATTSLVERFITAFQQGGVVGVAGEAASTAGELIGKKLGNFGPILQAVGAVIGIISGIFAAVARKIADNIKKTVDKINQDLSLGFAGLGDSIVKLEQQRIKAISDLSGRKGGKKQLEQLLPGLESQIAQLQKQQRDLQLAFDNSLSDLKLQSDTLSQFAQTWRDINKTVKDYLESFVSGSRELDDANKKAQEFLSLQLKKLQADAQRELNDGEKQSLQDAIDLNQLLIDRNKLIDDFNKAQFNAQAGNALERRQSLAVQEGLQLQQQRAEFEKQKSDLDEQIQLKTKIVDKEKQIFSLAESTFELKRRSDELTLLALDEQIKKWQDLQTIVNGITNVNGTLGLGPGLAGSVGTINLAVNVSVAGNPNPQQVGDSVADAIANRFRQGRTGF